MSSAFDQSRTDGFDEDIRLVDRFLGGEAGAFDILYSKYYDRVYAVALGVLLKPEEAADATQEIFTLVYRNLTKFDKRSKFSTWIYRVAVNRSIQQARTIKNQKLNLPLDVAADRPATNEDHSVDPRVSYALSKLGPDDRAAITLFYWDDLSLTEIGDTLGISANAAKTRLFRARERFRHYYEEVAD
ncbi:MAG: sigma-70 family RNA polymerase sigma factor [Chthonomonas sp.]|nr:sigma-70 family RNA polymerase sigma factor [Chthonomonas sp.]